MLDWSTLKIHCHLCQMAIISNTTKLMTVFSRWTIHVPLLRSPNSECSSLAEFQHQDQFNEAGVEINSPHYTSLRDGNRIAIPDEHIPKSYKEPSFGIRDA